MMLQGSSDRHFYLNFKNNSFKNHLFLGNLRGFNIIFMWHKDKRKSCSFDSNNLNDIVIESSAVNGASQCYSKTFHFPSSVLFLKTKMRTGIFYIIMTI